MTKFNAIILVGTLKTDPEISNTDLLSEFWQNIF
jgi:hypothetical protein